MDNKGKVLELSPKVRPHLVALQAFDDQHEVDDTMFGPIMDLIKVIPQVACALDPDMAKGLEEQSIGFLYKLVDRGLASIQADTLSPESLVKYKGLLQCALVAMPFDGRVSVWKNKFEAFSEREAQKDKVGALAIVMQSVQIDGVAFKQAKHIELAVSSVAYANLSESTKTSCEALLQMMLMELVSIFAENPDGTGELASAAQAVAELLADGKSSKYEPLLEGLRGGLATKSAIDDIVKDMGSAGDDWDATPIASSANMARLQVLLQLGSSALRELPKCEDLRGFCETFLPRFQELVDKGLKIERSIGNNLLGISMVDLTQKLDALADKRFGAAGGSSWFADLEDSKAANWAHFYKHAEGTIMKDASIAALRVPIEEAQKVAVKH